MCRTGKQKGAAGCLAALRFAGAYIAFMSGSGFATGQEVMQYYVAFGFHGIATILLVFALLAYAGARLVATGHREHFKRGSDVFAYYCGPVIGRFFDWFITFAIYMSFVVILAGAGAAMAQQFGLPAGAGVAITALLSCVTVIGGFGRMLKVLGNLGPVIIAMVFAVAIVGLARGAGNLAEADRAIASMQLLRAADFWWLSAVSYVGISMIWLTTFLTRLGAEAEDGRRATRGIVLGTAVFFSGVLVMTLAMMGNISALQGSQVPMLVLAEQLHPAVATAFAMIVSLGIYTASVPLLWTATARVAGERTRRSRYAVLVAALAGAVMAMTLSFDRLVNIVYVLCGYVGFFLCGAVLWKDLRAGYQRLCARSRAC